MTTSSLPMFVVYDHPRGEHVHHIDRNRENNDPANLEVAGSLAEHFLEHRKPGSNRRLPDEPNPVRECECGCGSRFDTFDKYARPRRFVSGHNARIGGRFHG